MKTKTSRKQYIQALLIGLLILVVSGSSAVAYAATTAPANGGMISGAVTSPLGYPLPEGTLVKLFDPDGESLKGLAQPDLEDGRFHIGPVPNGLYVLKAVPPESSGLTQSLPKAVSVVNAPVNVGVLALTEPQILGTVTAPDGITPADAQVVVYLGDGQVFQTVDAPAGEIRIGGLPVGGYGIQAFPVGDVPYWRSEVLPVSVSPLTTPMTITLTLREAQLWGYTQDGLGVPVAGAKVFATQASGERRLDISNANGFWAIGDLSDGEIELGAMPPWDDSGLLPPDPIIVELPGASNPYNLVFQSPPKQVFGRVTTNTGVPVNQALVLARRLNLPGSAETLTQADGSYRLDLAPGLWSLTVQAITDTVPEDWVYPHPPQLVYFQQNNEPEERQQDFEVLLADASVFGMVLMPDGSVPPFEVNVGLFNDEGVGVQEAIDPLDGSFEIRVPNGGYKVVIHPDDSAYVSPPIDPILVPPEGSYDLGAVSLLQRDALISGVITAEGEGVSGIPVVAWRPGVPGSLRTTSGPDGTYALAVSEGTWHIQPAPEQDQPYLYTGAGESVELVPGQLVENIDFELLLADATIQGALVLDSGEIAEDAFGWVTAVQIGNPQVHRSVSVEAGLFTVSLPAGNYRLAAHLPAGSPYMSTMEREVSLEPGATLDLELTVQVKDAKIIGALWDARNEDIVEGIKGIVAAWWGNNWVAAPINDGNGSYRLDIAAGLWHLNFRIDPQAGYAKISGPMNIPVGEGQTAVVPLRITPKDAQIQGTVLAPNGDPLAGATVFVQGVGPMLGNLWLQTRSGEDGAFQIDVPYGVYRIGASINNPDWIKPAEVHVVVRPESVSDGHILQFREPDTAVFGMLTVNNAPEDGTVHVWAWSDDGGFTQGRFSVALNGSQAEGEYRLGIISNITWHLGAVYETDTHYWYARAQVTPGDDEVEQDLILEGPYPKPAPVVVTFDASEPQHIALADGTHIFIPAGAMPVEGTVNLRIVPIATLPHQQHANVLRYGYAFLATDEYGQPIEAHFNQDVVITFTYQDEDLTQWHILEAWLKPAYFSTTTNQWTFPESFVVDTEANRVIMQIDHFTDYALTGSGSYTIFLPMTTK